MYRCDYLWDKAPVSTRLVVMVTGNSETQRDLMMLCHRMFSVCVCGGGGAPG